MVGRREEVARDGALCSCWETRRVNFDRATVAPCSCLAPPDPLPARHACPPEGCSDVTGSPGAGVQPVHMLADLGVGGLKMIRGGPGSC